MKLKIKDKYLDYSIGGGSLKTIKLIDIDPLLYEKYYNNGFSEFFEKEKKNLTIKDNKVIEELMDIIEEKLEDEKNIKKEDDINK